jgi:hypothetical protein
MKIQKLNHGSTIFLRLAASALGLGVLALCLFLLPELWVHAYDEFPHTGYAVRVIVAAMYAAAVPFYLGIYRGFQLLNLVDNGKVFSKSSVAALRIITYYAAAISIVYLIVLPFFYLWQDEVDAPGLMVIGVFLVGMPMIVSVALGLLSRLLREAVVIKSENELTV